MPVVANLQYGGLPGAAAPTQGGQLPPSQAPSPDDEPLNAVGLVSAPPGAPLQIDTRALIPGGQRDVGRPDVWVS